MRILYLIDNFSLGGAQTIVKGLMDHNSKNSQIHAIALREKSPVMTIDHPNAIVFPSPSKYSLKVLRFLKEFIAENKIEILHCQLPRSIALGYLLKRAYPQLKYIIHEQGDIFESRAHASLLRIFKRKADGVLACSEATAKMLERRSGLDFRGINILYNFVDLNRFEAGNPASFKGSKIAFAGRIEKRKGWREFIHAADRLRVRKGLSFVLAGKGTEEQKLVRAIRKLQNANISYLGFKADMTAFYKEADLLVIPSHFEPMGMVAAEAMACGTPVLAANVPGLNEIVIHRVNGWTYPSKSVSELVKAIESILDSDPEKIRIIIDQGLKDVHAFSLLDFSSKLQQYHSSLM